MDEIRETELNLWRDDRAAKALEVSRRPLFDLTAPRGPVPCVRVGRSVRYDPRDIRAYIAANKVGAAISA